MGAGEPHEFDDLRDPLGVELVRAGGAERDLALVGRRLVVDGEPADTVVHRAGDARRPDRVERIHRCHEPESRRRRQATETGNVQFALAHHGDQDVQRLLGHTVDLLDVQQRPVAQRRCEWPVDEDVGVVALGHDPGRVEVTDQACRCEFGVALDELEADAELVGDGTQQRRLPGAGGTLDHDVTVGDQRRHDQLDLSPATHDGGSDRCDEFRWSSRCSVAGRFRHVPSSLPNLVIDARARRIRGGDAQGRTGLNWIRGTM